MDTKYKENYIRLGLKIAYYRKLRGMTQEQFAEAIRKSWSFIALVESPSKAAGVSLETLFKMADILEIEPYLVFCIIFFQLISYVLPYRSFVLSYCIHKISSAPKTSLSIFVF